MKKLVSILLACTLFAGIVWAARGDIWSVRSGSTDVVRVPNSTSMVPGTDDTVDLGSSSLEWKDLYVDGVAYIDSQVGGKATNYAAITTATTVTVTVAQSNTLFMNLSKSASCVYQLPTPTTGVSFIFSDVETVAGRDVYVSAPANVTINGQSTASVVIYKCVVDAPDQTIELFGTSAGAYIFLNNRGTWTTDTAYIH